MDEIYPTKNTYINLLHMKKIGTNLLRLVWYGLYRLLKLLGCGKVITIPIGWDTLFPLAPYSEGGLLRKDFLELYRKGELTTEEYQEKEFGKFIEETQTFEFWKRKFANQEYLAHWWI